MDLEVIYQELRYVGSEQRGKSGPEIDVFDAEMEQGEKDGNGFLFVPGKDQREGKVVYAAIECLRERYGDLNGAESVVALTHIHKAGQTCHGAEVHIV